MVTLLLAGNIAFHLEAHFNGSAEYGARIGIAAVVLLIVVIGGRIIPSFTRNWLARENPGRLPAPFARFDVVVIGFSAATLGAVDRAAVGRMTARGARASRRVLHIVRLARWAGDRTWRDRLVLILHVGYAFVPFGFLLAERGARSASVAAKRRQFMPGWSARPGTMTLAVMTRASLGHTGSALDASAMTQAIYAAVVIAALARICASLQPALERAAAAYLGRRLGHRFFRLCRCLRAIARSGTAIESSMISSAGNGWFGLPLSSRCHTGSPSGNAGASSLRSAAFAAGRNR